MHPDCVEKHTPRAPLEPRGLVFKGSLARFLVGPPGFLTTFPSIKRFNNHHRIGLINFKMPLVKIEKKTPRLKRTVIKISLEE